ncbi:hypothetical protein GOV14_03630 [Candidatus Pacearchaeota archaeon]|nr:hypothetical protein [Candidatus Pacearchaeota archaeon]
MLGLDEIFKCSICKIYVEKTDIVNFEDISDNHVCVSCGKKKSVKIKLVQ